MKLFECNICKKKSTEEEDFEVCVKCNQIICIDCVDHYEDYVDPVCEFCESDMKNGIMN